MKTRISNERYIASAAPIIGDYGEKGKPVEYFIVNPIVKTGFLGIEKIVGAVEAISQVKLFECYFYSNSFDGTGYCCWDAVDTKGEIGDTAWNAKFDYTANKFLTEEAINEYFKKTPEEMTKYINDMRKRNKESVKGNYFSRALR